MNPWDPAIYEAFREQRQQPFLDLLAAIPALDPRVVVDAGCGTGRTTLELARRYPSAQVIGVDHSPQMLAEATGLEFIHADIATWRPPLAADLVVSNAVLHWIPGPGRTARHLGSWLAPGGVLAIQVPANHDAPSHRITYEEADNHGLEAVPRGDHILDLDGYRRALSGYDVTAWDHSYRMALQGDDAVYRWLLGTTLRPYLGRPRHEEFLDAVRRRLRSEYPPGAVTKYTFRRRFVIAVKEGEA